MMGKGNGAPQVQKRRETFLAEYARSGNISHSARHAGVDRGTHYKWLADPAYAEAFKLADADAGDALEAEARRRAVEGVDEPVGWYKGKAGGVVRRYSDTLLIFMLKGRKPDVYGDKHQIEHTGKGGGPIETATRVTVYMPDNGRSTG